MSQERWEDINATLRGDLDFSAQFLWQVATVYNGCMPKISPKSKILEQVGVMLLGFSDAGWTDEISRYSQRMQKFVGMPFEIVLCSFLCSY